MPDEPPSETTPQTHSPSGETASSTGSAQETVPAQYTKPEAIGQTCRQPTEPVSTGDVAAPSMHDAGEGTGGTTEADLPVAPSVERYGIARVRVRHFRAKLED